MCELSGCDLLCESGFHLNLHLFKTRDCGYAMTRLCSTAMTSGAFIHVMSLLQGLKHLKSVSFRKPAWIWSWKLWLSSENCRYRKALKTLLRYVKILDSPFKGELGFLKLWVFFRYMFYVVKLNLHVCICKYSHIVFPKDCLHILFSSTLFIYISLTMTFMSLHCIFFSDGFYFR